MLVRDTFQSRHTLCLSLCLLVACASAPTQELNVPLEYDEHTAETAPTPVIRQGRYTQIELRPEFAQQNLLWQIIDLRLPATPGLTTVGDALRYVLRYSGYHLCDGDPELTNLWALPLPAVHLRLGPLPLNQVLQLLVGSAWQLLVDERERQICFAKQPLSFTTETQASP